MYQTFLQTSIENSNTILVPTKYTKILVPGGNTQKDMTKYQDLANLIKEMQILIGSLEEDKPQTPASMKWKVLTKKTIAAEKRPAPAARQERLHVNPT